MITPRFQCTQSENAVIISIYCPSVRASDVEINVDEALFTLHINPYFLRLNFSHNLVEDEESSAHYDPSSGYLTVTLSKETKGQEFKDLDLLAKLLAPRPTGRNSEEPAIEVISTKESSQDSEDEDDLVTKTRQLDLKTEREEILKAAASDWRLPQVLSDPIPSFSLSAERRYGFLDMHSGYFKHVVHTENEVNELGPDTETCPVDKRRKLRLQHEDKKWDEEHYMADYADDEYIKEILTWKHPHITDINDFKYTEDENAALLRLPRKEYLMTPAQYQQLYMTLITILFAYAYEMRTTQYDPTPESAWTISSLIPAFSALDPPDYDTSATTAMPSLPQLSAALIPSYRRSLSFPLYRSFALAEACRRDAAELLRKGKRTVVRCLLEIKHILDHHEVYYVYSKIWLDDFCVWTQAYASDEVIFNLGQCLMELKMEKSSIGWDLEALEAIARDVDGRESDSDDE